MTGVPDLSQPFAFTAAVAMAGFVAFLVRDLIRRLDASEARVSKLTDSVDKLTDAVKDGFRSGQR